MNKKRRQQIIDLAKQVQLLLGGVENLNDADELVSAVYDIRDAEAEAVNAKPAPSDTDDENIERLDTAHSKLEEVSTAITQMSDDLQEVISALGDIE